MESRLPGTERPVQLGGDGTPTVGDYTPAEWRSPHRRTYLVNATGTHPLGDTEFAQAISRAAASLLQVLDQLIATTRILGIPRVPSLYAGRGTDP